MPDVPSTSAPSPDKSTWTLNSPEVKEQIWRGLSDFKTVFFYPLCTGIMTGVGFMAGKKIGERYFFGSSPKNSSA